MPDARNRRERLYHPEGGHTSTELDILSEPMARALAVARLEAEAEDVQRDGRDVRRRRAGKPPPGSGGADHGICQGQAQRAAAVPATAQVARHRPDCGRILRRDGLDMAVSGRTARVVRPRQVFCYLARKHTFQLVSAHRPADGKDHTTVLCGVQQNSLLVMRNAKLAADLAAIRKVLGGHERPVCRPPAREIRRYPGRSAMAVRNVVAPKGRVAVARRITEP